MMETNSVSETLCMSNRPHMLDNAHTYSYNDSTTATDRRERNLTMVYVVQSYWACFGLIHRLVCGRQKIPQRFGDWICLRPQMDEAGQTYSVGPFIKS
jgi:hypothetical protein